MLGIYYIYTSSKFNYNSLEKTIIKKMEKHFIKCLNVVALNTISTPIKISFIYAPHIIELILN